MKILGIGKNYVIDIADKNTSKDGKQIIFTKPTSSLVKNNEDIEFPSITDNLAFEVEIVAKIGTKGKNISEADALNYISEIAVGIDFTAKDILADYRGVKGPWDLAKGFDGSSPISSFKPVSEYKDLNNLNLSLKINGEERQNGNTQFMIYNFAEIIAYISKFMTLEPGDLIFTGTPAEGAGKTLKGDHLQAYIEDELLLDFKMI